MEGLNQKEKKREKIRGCGQQCGDWRVGGLEVEEGIEGFMVMGKHKLIKIYKIKKTKTRKHKICPGSAAPTNSTNPSESPPPSSLDVTNNSIVAALQGQGPEEGAHVKRFTLVPVWLKG